MTLEVTALIEVMKEQESIFAEFLSLADEQLQVLKSDDLEKLVQITARQEEKGRTMALLEKKRREILADYSQEIGTEFTHLSELFAHINNTEQVVLQKLASEIKEKHRQLEETTNLNRVLLQQGLSYANRVLGCFNTEKSVYGKTGNIRETDSNRIINKSV